MRQNNPGLFLDKIYLLGVEPDELAGGNLNRLLERIKDKMPQPDENIMKKRAKELLDAAKSAFGGVEHFQARLKTHLLVGTGAPNPLEASLFTVLPYGYPEIPGSSLKGLARAADRLQGETRDTERIFGGTEKRGEVVWLPGVPLTGRLGLTIFNVHYPEYYRGGDFKEWENPNIIWVPAVLPGAIFQFAVAGKDKKLLKEAKELLAWAVAQLGPGSHTRVGFGLFEL